MDPTHEALARELAAAWVAGSTVDLPRSRIASRQDAYRIQDHMARLIGQPVAGWKVGATVRAVQIFEGHDGPLPGRIFADRCFDSPAQVPSHLLQSAKVECEFAFRLTHDLDASAGSVTAENLAASLTFHPAIEIAASRWSPGTGNRSPTTFDGIADNGSSGAVVIGAGVADWQSIGFETLPIDARIDDSPSVQAYSGAYRRDPVEIMAETFNDLLARNVPLPKGTIVLTGSLTLPTPIRHRQTFKVRMGELPPMSLTMT